MSTEQDASEDVPLYPSPSLLTLDELQATARPPKPAGSSRNVSDTPPAYDASMAKTEVDEDSKKSAKVECEEDAEKKKKKDPEPKVSFLQLFRFADKIDVLLIIFGLIGSAAQGITLPAFSLIFGALIDTLNNPDPAQLQESMINVSLYFLYIGLAAFVVAYTQNVCWKVTSIRQTVRLRQAYLRAIMRQDIAWFDVTGTGELISRISNDTGVVQTALGEKLGQGVQFFSTFIAGFALGFSLCWQLTLLMVGVTPLLAIAGGTMMKVLSSLSTRGQLAYASAGSVASEVLAASRTVSSFAAEEKEIKRYVNNLRDARRIGVRKGFVSGLGLGSTMAVMFGAYALAMWFGSYLIVHFGLSGGQIVSVFFAVLIGAFALGQAGPSQAAVANGQGAAFKMFATIDRQPLIDPLGDSGAQLPSISGRIELRNVAFRYPSRPEQRVFSDMNLVVEPGQTVALVGPSGAGKSSVVALLERFYDPTSGQVLVDGVDITSLNLRWWRSQVGLVSQEPVLFSGTIAENISHGLPGATQEEIEEAARAANAHKFILEFPNKYNTAVGNNGAQLSGGQKQRIAIARAILKNPRILLLDEATSALDTQSEGVVQQALDNARSGRTTIVIAHRLSTVRSADKIAVVFEGRVVEQGTHKELKALKGKYYDLIKLQGMDTESMSDSKQDNATIRRQGLAHTTEVDLGDDDEDRVMADPDDLESGHKKKSKKTKKKKGKNGKDEPVKKVGLFRIVKYNVTEIPLILLGCLASAANGATNPIFAIIFSKMIAVFFLPTDQVLEGSFLWSMIFLAIAFATLLANVVQASTFGYAGEMLTQRLRRDMFAAIMRCDQGWFDHPDHSVGKLTDTLATQATLVQGVTGGQLSLAVQNLVTIGAGLGIAFYNGWKLTLVLIACTPLMLLQSVLDGMLMKGKAGSPDKLADANAAAGEAIQNIRTTASFTLQKRFLDEYDTRVSLPVRRNKFKAQISGVLAGFGQLAIFGVYSLAFWYGSVLIVDGQMNFEQVLTVFMAIAMSSMAIGQTTALAPDAGKASGAAAQVFELIDTHSTIDSFSVTGQRPEKVSGELELKNVHFTYPSRPTAPVLKGVSLRVEPGKVLALVGASGSGKSSVVALLERFYDPHEGQIFIDGIDIKDLHLKTMRQRIGLVSQEPVLFVGTIGENIAYSSNSATREQIEAAAKSANAHNFIMQFPRQYDTQVGEKGAQLSGGQKQRIAIARAILKNPTILLLDEATSALDTESERIVQEALDHVMKNRTTVVIAHRLTTIRNADTIAVINSGQVAEQGTHEELMERKALYYALVNRQTGAH